LTEPLQVGQFAIVDGEPVDRGPNAGVFHGKGPADDRAELFILAEGTTPAGEAFAGHVISALGQSFASLDMSLTGALRRLFVEAEHALEDWNRKSIAQHRVSLGMSAFGRRGAQAVLAQAGPSAAYHLHNGSVTAHFAEFQHASPLGSAPAQPHLTRLDFDDDDRLLLISSPALHQVDEELIAGILQLPADQVLPDLYRRVQGMRQVTVVLVTGPAKRPQRSTREAVEPDEVVIDATIGAPAREDATYQPSLFIDDKAGTAVQDARAQLLEITPRRQIEALVPAFVSEAPAPLLRVAGESSVSLTRMAAEGAARAARSRAAVQTIAAESQAARRPAWHAAGSSAPVMATASSVSLQVEANATPGSPRQKKSQSFTRGLVPNNAPAARPDLLGEDLPLVDTMATATRSRNTTTIAPVAETLASESGAAMAGGAPLIRPRHNMGGRWKGGNAFGGRTTLGGQLPPTWMVSLGALVVLLLLAGILTVPRMLSEDNHQRVQTLLEGAQERIAGAATKADAGEKRQMLSEAQAMLLEARDLGGSAQADQLISQVAGALVVIDNVKAPQSVETVASLEQFGAKPVSVSRMALSADSAYLLDVNASQVVRVPLTGGEPASVFSENKDLRQAKPVAIAQLDQSDQGGPVLLIADISNKLWAYSQAGGVRVLALAAPANLAISDIAVYGRDLYVLDAGQSTVYRFQQNADGFSNPPQKALVSSDLSGARRLMVDTEFVTSDANGTLHRFINGQVALTLSQAGIDKRLVAPETAQAMSKTELALLDAANDRIVVLTRDGTFDRQYRSKDFAGASAFAIRDGVAYIYSGALLRRIAF
jgi:hypothetical protein